MPSSFHSFLHSIKIKHLVLFSFAIVMMGIIYTSTQIIQNVDNSTIYTKASVNTLKPQQGITLQENLGIGDSWVAKGPTKNWLDVAMSADGSRQTAVVNGGQIYISTDYGNTWSAKGSTLNWYGVTMSTDGSRQTAVVHGGQIYISTDYGNTWSAKGSTLNWYGVAMSADGSRQIATVWNGQIYVSTDYGNTWSAKGSTLNWTSVAMSADGSRQTATVSSGQIYISTDYGNTWTTKGLNNAWTSVAMSADGSIQTAVIWSSTGQIYISTNYGNTWSAKGPLGIGYEGVAMSADGSRQTAVALGGQIYVSTDYGNTWSAKGSTLNWASVAMSADGSRQTAVTSGGGQIYILSTMTPSPTPPYTTRQDMCLSLAVSTRTLNAGQSVTITSATKPIYPANTFSYAFYNMDNVYGPGNPKPLCVTTGGDDTSITAPCPPGSHQLIYWDLNKATRNNGSRMLGYGNIFLKDMQLAGSSAQTKNVQVNGYFQLGTYPVSLPNPACVSWVSAFVPSPTVTRVPSPSVTAVPLPSITPIRATPKP